MFDELANELKTAREKNQMSLAQLANKSKIDIKFLEAIEHGDFDFLPELYVKAFVKSYARVVGLNENKISKKFDAAKRGIPYVEEEPTMHEIIRDAAETKKLDTISTAPKIHTVKTQREIKRSDVSVTFDAVGSGASPQDSSAEIKKRNLIIGGSILGAVFLFALVYLLFIHKSTEDIVVEKPIEEVIQQSQRFIDETDVVESDKLGIAAADSLYLTINVSDTSWIKVSVDDHGSEEFILLPNSQKSIKAEKNYKLVLGNSGAVKLQLNNKSLPFSGRSKVPVSVTIDRDGLKYSDSQSAQR